MWTDLRYFLSSLHPEQVVGLFLGLLLMDMPRYALTSLAMVCIDLVLDARRAAARLMGRRTPGGGRMSFCPSVCLVLPAYNEEQVLGHTLESAYGSYPNMQIIIVDDGSTDGTCAVGKAFARRHRGVRVLCTPRRSGKSAAMNLALRYTDAEVIVVADTDSHLDTQAIWEVVQPLRDRRVGAVSASVLVRNPFQTVVTLCQAFEYLSTIMVGRIFAARLGILAIASGGFAAFRRSVLEQVGGMDVGPGEDADITLRIRKAGYKIAFVPYAQCFTEVPHTWRSLFKQRLRWDQSIVRYKLRKHVDMAWFWHKNFRPTNGLHLLDIWYFHLFRSYAFWVWAAWFYATHPLGQLWQVVAALWATYLCMSTLQAGTVLFYSDDKKRDLPVLAVLPIYSLYQLFLRTTRTIAMTRELVWRMSFDDNYVPEHVRRATWRW